MTDAAANPRILLVDDEPNLLDALRRQLRREFSIETAGSGAEGLNVLRDKGPFVVVVSDFRMPGMDGATFLAAARGAAPDTTRVLLTGQADLAGTAAVVNQGQVFRLLLKPVGQDELIGALHDSVAYQQLRLAERVLLEETLQGSVRALMDVLALSNPAVAVVNAEDKFSGRMIKDCKARIIRFGFGKTADYRARDISITAQGTNFILNTPDGIDFLPAQVAARVPAIHRLVSSTSAAR